MEFDVGFGGALMAGLASFFSPCVLPIVPAYLCFLAGVSLEELTDSGAAVPGARLRIVVTAFVFALGFATVFVLLGASASVLGQALARYFDTLRWVAGVVILVMGLHFLGVVRIPLLFRQARIEVERRPATLAGAYLVGLAFGFGWTPCVGPVLAAILFIAGTEESAVKGATLLGSYAVGMGAPFVLAAAFAGAFMGLMRRARRHLGTIERIMGGALVVTGILFIGNVIPDIAEWMIGVAPIRG